MFWVATAKYNGDSVEFTVETEKSDDLKDGLVKARDEACRIFGYFDGGAPPGAPPTVHVKKHPNII
jgi:hypothetical protein